MTPDALKLRVSGRLEINPAEVHAGLPGQHRDNAVRPGHPGRARARAIVRLVATDLASLQVASVSESVSLSDWLPAVAARSSSYRDS
jgi:hypothetical protein